MIMLFLYLSNPEVNALCGKKDPSESKIIKVLGENWLQYLKVMFTSLDVKYKIDSYQVK